MECIMTKGRKIGPGKPTYIIAEMAWSHDGSVDKASYIIQEAHKAGADAISIHITSVPDYMVPHYGNGKGRVSSGKENNDIYRYLESVNLTFEDWSTLLPFSKDLGLDICVMCNDWPSFQFAQGFNPDMYVISAASFVEEDFVRAMARTQKPLMLRVGGALLGEIENVLFWSQEEGNSQIILLFGFQNYPTTIEDTHLAFLDALKRTFGFQVGLADHLDADDEMALVLPLLAIPYGATVIEKHVTHERRLKGEDFESALNPDELKKLVSHVRWTEKAIGSPHIQHFYQAMESYRNVSRKRIVAASEIREGEKISKETVAFKRSDGGMSPAEVNYVIGKRAKTRLNVNDPITPEAIM